jgi:SulP family sulfate permease
MVSERTPASRPERRAWNRHRSLLMANPSQSITAATPRSALVGDLWGALASSLVALPASIAFGVAVFAPLGTDAGAGALAGMLGAVALGIVAPLLGGTPRLISAPCAPAVAVMAAFAIQMTAEHPHDPGRIVVLMTLVGLLAALLQLAFGLARLGTFIKYIPYPVVTGYLSGVGLAIFLKQIPVLFGLAKGTAVLHGLGTPSLWQVPSLVVAVATIAVMALAPRVTRRVPAAILGLLAGVAAYFALALFRPELLTLAGNRLVIGPIGADAPSFGAALQSRVAALGSLQASDLRMVLGPALTLAVLLSLDTLKTCVVVDALTGARHESNRELFGQGTANTVSALIGGMSGAGTSGATLVNLASGGQTRRSGIFEGVAVLVAFLALGGVLGWTPLAALAGILTVVAARMFDWSALRLARQRSTALDFFVVAAVIAVAVGVDLITASAVGVALSILLFIRNASRGAIIRRKLYGDKVFSKRRRLPEQARVLAAQGRQTVVVQLTGSLFFGTTDRLRTLLQDDLDHCRTIILDLRHVDALDLTAAHILEQMQAQLRARGARMVFCNLPRHLAGQADAASYLAEVGVIHPQEQGELFGQISDALAAAEDRILAESAVAEDEGEAALELPDMEMFRGRRQQTVDDLRQCLETRVVPAGEPVFRQGDAGDEIFFVRKGSVRIQLLVAGKTLHLASVGRADFFGEIAFLDGGLRSADAVAECACELYALSRQRFDAVAQTHPRLGQGVFAALARALALRLRAADNEIATLEDA